jgi:hypothetical protein
MNPCPIAAQIRIESAVARQQKKDLREMVIQARVLSRRANAITKGLSPPLEGERPLEMQQAAMSIRREAECLRERIRRDTQDRRYLTLAAALLHNRRYPACEARTQPSKRLTRYDYGRIGRLIQHRVPEDGGVVARMWHLHERTYSEIQGKSLERLLEIEATQVELSQAQSAVKEAQMKLQGHTARIKSIEGEAARLKKRLAEEEIAMQNMEPELERRKARVALLQRELIALQ